MADPTGTDPTGTDPIRNDSIRNRRAVADGARDRRHDVRPPFADISKVYEFLAAAARRPVAGRLQFPVEYMFRTSPRLRWPSGTRSTTLRAHGPLRHRDRSDRLGIRGPVQALSGHPDRFLRRWASIPTTACMAVRPSSGPTRRSVCEPSRRSRPAARHRCRSTTSAGARCTPSAASSHPGVHVRQRPRAEGADGMPEGGATRRGVLVLPRAHPS